MPDILTEDPRWESIGLETLAGEAISKALQHLGIDARMTDISLLVCDDQRITALNTEFRDKQGPTNVLSWPSEDLSAQVPGMKPLAPEPGFDDTFELGDIAIAWETCAREAGEMGISMQDHVTHLIVHGLLHLLGYDHIRDPDATLMQRTESEILGKLGVDDPYKR